MKPCPECGREHMYGLSWRHTTSCPFYERDSATAAADHERGRGIRAMTETERTLVDDYYLPPPSDGDDGDWEWGVRFAHSGFHHRSVVYKRDNFAIPAERPKKTTTTETNGETDDH